MSRAKSSLKSEILFVLLLGSICAMILALTRAGVGNRSELQVDTVNAVMQIIVGKEPENAETAFAAFNRRFTQKSSGRCKIWQNQDQLQQWVFEATGAGMWGEMTLVGVLDLEAESLLGLRVVRQNETAGLGSRITDSFFTEQFVNLSLLPKIEMTSARSKINQVDAISGATVSSRSLEKLLNKAVKLVKIQALKKK
jgi:RnfABCDGE-type electron transport complex G subunit